MKPSAHRSLRAFVPVLAILLLSACASTGKEKALNETLDAYRQAIRWGGIESGLSFVDPEFLKQRPYTALDLERYAQIAITAYREGDPVMGPDGKVRQTIGISLYNRHTLVERNLIDQQVWRYDEDLKRWWLETGLPDITRAR